MGNNEFAYLKAIQRASNAMYLDDPAQGHLVALGTLEGWCAANLNKQQVESLLAAMDERTKQSA